MKQLLTVKEVAELTRLTKATIYTYVAARKIPHIKLGARTMFEEHAIIEWIEARRVAPINTEFSNV